MRYLARVSTASLIISSWCLSTAFAAEPVSISLKGGETAEVGTVYWVSNCRSLLTADPTAEIMEGPADVTVSVKKQDVIPRKNSCAKPIRGGMLVVAAPKEVKARTEGKLTVRLNYKTLDGDRQTSREFNVTL